MDNWTQLRGLPGQRASRHRPDHDNPTLTSSLTGRASSVSSTQRDGQPGMTVDADVPALPATAVGAQLLDDLAEALADYIVFPSPEALHATSLWVAATHFVAVLDHATRLVITSPTKRCGKSRLLDLLFLTCHDPLMSASTSPAGIFRSLRDPPQTVLLDEVDTVLGPGQRNEQLRAFLNAGYDRGRPVIRIETIKGVRTPVDYPSFAMVALASIGALPDTIEDRSVKILLCRKLPSDQSKPFRQRRDGPRLKGLHQRLMTWADEIQIELVDVEPENPLEDRAADRWDPLLSVADAAGGAWPNRARVAALAMSSEQEQRDAPVDVRLLRDLRVLLAHHEGPFAGSTELVALLRNLPDSPWAEMGLSPHRLRDLLAPFGIRPTKNSAGTARGYRTIGFHDAFARYVSGHGAEPSEASGVRSVAVERPDGSDASSSGSGDTHMVECNDVKHNRDVYADPANGCVRDRKRASH